MRRTAMRRTRPKTVSADFRVRLAARSNGCCEMTLPGCTYRATDVAHRISKKAGGRPLDDLDRLSNVLHACRTCHRWTHDSPRAAYDLGLMLKEHQDPEVEPVAYQNAGWVRLDDEGGLWPV